MTELIFCSLVSLGHHNSGVAMTSSTHITDLYSSALSMLPASAPSYLVLLTSPAPGSSSLFLLTSPTQHMHVFLPGVYRPWDCVS